MQRDAEAHAEEDAKKKDLADKRNTADMSIFTAEKSLKDYGDKVDEETKKDIEDKLAALKTAKDGEDVDDIDKKTQELAESLQKIGEIMAKEAEASGETPAEDAPQDVEVQAEEISEDGKEESGDKS